MTFGECDDFSGRVKFNGDFNQNECGVEIFGARLEDAGDWTCQLESYSFGGQGGEKAKVDSSWKIYWLIEYFLYCRNHSESPSFRKTSWKCLEMMMMMMMIMILMILLILLTIVNGPSHLESIQEIPLKSLEMILKIPLKCLEMITWKRR